MVYCGVQTCESHKSCMSMQPSLNCHTHLLCTSGANQTSMCPRVYMILVCDTRQQPGETRDLLTWTSRTAKKARVNEAIHEHPRLHESIRSEASVFIYILALALSQVFSARVYSRHNIFFAISRKLLQSFTKQLHKISIKCFKHVSEMSQHFPNF